MESIRDAAAAHEVHICCGRMCETRELKDVATSLGHLVAHDGIEVATIMLGGDDGVVLIAQFQDRIDE